MMQDVAKMKLSPKREDHCLHFDHIWGKKEVQNPGRPGYTKGGHRILDRSYATYPKLASIHYSLKGIYT